MLDNSLLDQSISLSKLTLHVLDVPQKMHFVSGIGERKSRKTLIIEWEDTEGNSSFGECSCRPDPYYSDEFLEGAILCLKQFVVPHLKTRQTYREVLQVLRRIRGWNFTKSALEATVFQLARRQSHYSLATDISATPVEAVPVGISLGIYQDPGELHEVVSEALDEGYRRIKFKISPTVDTTVFDRINPLLFDNDVYTGFDANGSFFTEDLDKLEYFVKTYKGLIEQPLPPTRYDAYLAARKRFPDLRICADEEVKSLGDLIKLNELNAIDELNLKIGRVGGMANSVEVINYCHEQGLPCWVGGMFETGVGRVLNLEFAAYLPQARAHDLSPSSRYFAEDIITPTVTMSNGHVSVQEFTNYEIDRENLQKFTVTNQAFSV